VLWYSTRRRPDRVPRSFNGVDRASANSRDRVERKRVTALQDRNRLAYVPDISAALDYPMNIERSRRDRIFSGELSLAQPRLGENCLGVVYNLQSDRRRMAVNHHEVGKSPFRDARSRLGIPRFSVVGTQRTESWRLWLGSSRHGDTKWRSIFRGATTATICLAGFLALRIGSARAPGR